MPLATKRSLAPVVTLVAVLIPLVARAQERDARQAIPALLAKHVADYNAGHPEMLGEAYASDAAVLPPNRPAVRGRKAITEWWQESWNAGLRNFSITPGEIYVEGNLATENGTYGLDVPTGAARPPMHDTGKYMLLWKRSPTAGWQLFRDIFNSDNPTPAMAASASATASSAGGMAQSSHRSPTPSGS